MSTARAGAQPSQASRSTPTPEHSQQPAANRSEARSTRRAHHDTTTNQRQERSPTAQPASTRHNEGRAASMAQQEQEQEHSQTAEPRRSSTAHRSHR